jgi:hypothetical protein
MNWSPRFTLTPAIARGLMQIKAARALMDYTLLSTAAEAELPAHARVRAMHYSTYIEGNRLTMSQAKAAISDADLQIAGGERNVFERMTRNLLKDWVEDGWQEVADPSCRARSYRLSAKYRQYIGSLSAMVQGGEKNEQ